MLIKTGEFDCTECWDGVFYKNLQIILLLQNGKSKRYWILKTMKNKIVEESYLDSE